MTYFEKYIPYSYLYEAQRQPLTYHYLTNEDVLAKSKNQFQTESSLRRSRFLAPKFSTENLQRMENLQTKLADSRYNRQRSLRRSKIAGDLECQKTYLRKWKVQRDRGTQLRHYY